MGAVKLTHRGFALNECAGLIIGHALSFPDAEVCGLILDSGDVVQMKNRSSVHDQFEMGEEFEQYRDHTIAIYHSHVGLSTGAELSPADILNSKEQGIPYLVYHPEFKQWDYFDPLALHPFPLEMDFGVSPKTIEYYLLWRFVYGRSDCYSLVRAWYAGMLGIALQDYPRIDLENDTLTRSTQFSALRIRSEGFEQLPRDTEIQTHDILSITLGEQRAGHVAIVCDAEANQILHNVGEGRYSFIEGYNDEWRDRTVSIFRYVGHDHD